jgi:hypothetical protein|tara:strand:+ start:548 stop:685 length:138 start_codon:yes stop_codon:yes gene_type:complete
MGISSSEISGINLAVVTALLVLSFGYAALRLEPLTPLVPGTLTRE